VNHLSGTSKTILHDPKYYLPMTPLVIPLEAKNGCEAVTR
jgi:hypothetical protein